MSAGKFEPQQPNAELTKTASGALLVRWVTTAVCALLAVGPGHAQVANRPPLNDEQIYYRMLKSSAYVGVNIESGPDAGASGIGVASLVDKKNRLLLTSQHVVHMASQGK